MGKWLAKFSDKTPKGGTDITDTLPDLGTMSVLSVEDSGLLPKISPTHLPQVPTPLSPGWLVVYRDRTGTLHGGADDRAHGTVCACTWDGNDWRVLLADGQQLPLAVIRAVGHVDHDGRLLAAWTVKEHGFDGNG